MAVAKKLTNAEKIKQKMQLQKRYAQRISIAKRGRDYFLNKDYTNAVKRYTEYLEILAQVNDLEDIYSISPRHFDNRTQITELLLISHIYWEMAKTFEMLPRFQNSYDKCMQQFVKFTANQPYQVFNAEMLRKYIKKNRFKSKQINNLNKAYSQIYVQSKKCFIATHCFGENHQVTNDLRKLKNILTKHPCGISFIKWYYISSPYLINIAKKSYVFDLIVKIVVKPHLCFIAKVISKSKI